MKNCIKHVFRFLPSAITCCSILCGLWAIFLAFGEKNIVVSIVLVVMSAFFDAFDGRVARWLKVDSNFGVELDSLADFVSFGVAPIIIMFFSVNWQDDITAFSFLTIFPICMALRLARFNTLALGKPTNPVLAKFQKNFFFGLAAPIGALAFLMPLIASINGVNFPLSQNILLFYTTIISLFLVIPIPIFGSKTLHLGVKTKQDLCFTIFAIILVALFIAMPMKALFAGIIAYFCTIPLSCAVCLIGKEKIKKIDFNITSISK